MGQHFGEILLHPSAEQGQNGAVGIFFLQPQHELSDTIVIVTSVKYNRDAIDNKRLHSAGPEEVFQALSGHIQKFQDSNRKACILNLYDVGDTQIESFYFLPNKILDCITRGRRIDNVLHILHLTY